MNSTRGPLRFLLDYISPNAYVAWTQIHGLAQRHDRQVEPVPVLFAGLLRAHKLLGPAEVQVKWRWMVRDIERKAARLRIPLAPPRTHPFNPLLALRVSSAELDPDARRRLVDGLFRAVWVDGVDVADFETVVGLIDRAGLDGKALVQFASTAEAKTRVRQQTEQALSAGVFGVPTVLVDDQLFWGYDDFDHLSAYLAEGDPLDPAVIERWLAVKPSARR